MSMYNLPCFPSHLGFWSAGEKNSDLVASLIICQGKSILFHAFRSSIPQLYFPSTCRSGKLAEKAQLEGLFTGRPLPLSEGVNTFMVPTKWLDSWRDYLGATGKLLDVIGEPPSLEDAFTSAHVFCKHGNLSAQPPVLTWRKGELVQAQKVRQRCIMSGGSSTGQRFIYSLPGTPM